MYFSCNIIPWHTHIERAYISSLCPRLFPRRKTKRSNNAKWRRQERARVTAILCTPSTQDGVRDRRQEMSNVLLQRVNKRSTAAKSPERPFFLAVRHRRKVEDQMWFLNSPMGKSTHDSYTSRSYMMLNQTFVVQDRTYMTSPKVITPRSREDETCMTSPMVVIPRSLSQEICMTHSKAIIPRTLEPPYTCILSQKIIRPQRLVQSETR